jgi:hypothetical protein
MKWIKICALVVIFSLCGLQFVCSDMLPPAATTRKPEKFRTVRKEGIPAYSIAAGVVAVSLSGSLFALRCIRKRNVDLPAE